MLVRRIRGVLTTATVWGLGSSLLTAVFMSALALANGQSMRHLFSDLVDLFPMAFGFGVAAGALFALLILGAERHRALANLSEQRFRLWGILAGALPIAVFQGVMRIGQPQVSLSAAAYAILCGGVTGAFVAPAILREARRSRITSCADQAQIRPPVI